MFKNKKIIYLILIIVLLFIVAGFLYKQYGQSSSYTQTPKKDEETQQAPDITMKDMNGKKVKLSDFKGKPIVLNFWSSKCSPCREEMPEFNNVYRDYKDEVQFIMLNATPSMNDTVDDAKQYIKENKFSLPIFFDVDLNAQKTFGVTSLPSTAFIDKDGNIRYGIMGSINQKLLTETIQKIIK